MTGSLGGPYIMERALGLLEAVFLFSSSVSNFLRAEDIAPILSWLCLGFLFVCILCWSKIQRPTGDMTMFSYPLSIFNLFIFITLQLSKIGHAQSPDKDTTSIQSAGAAGATPAPLPSHASSEVVAVSGTEATFRAIFTVPPEADVGVPLLPNINDPNATDAQTVCPGYNASNVLRTAYGLTATLILAGPACNVYGTDVESLNLTVEYQSADRLSVRVVPSYIDTSNSSQYILPSSLVYQPTIDADADMSTLTSDLSFTWSNDPTFSFSVFRKSTGDIIFSTKGTKLVFENQFIEFSSSLPENYNLYGLGESIHGLRLGNVSFSDLHFFFFVL